MTERFLEKGIAVIALGLIICVYVANANAAVPEKAKPYKDAVITSIKKMDFPKEYPQSIPGQIEQETCISLKGRSCWNSHAELKTSREYGFGLGQLTVAYNKDMTERFNTFKEIKANKAFKNWEWSDRFNASYQIEAIIYKDMLAFRAITWKMDTYFEKLAITFAMYNGGIGSIIRDRALCNQTKDCDSSKWFGNIEKTSFKSRVIAKGYGKSFYDINREYPRNILFIRMKRYEEWFK
jgi:hypothetical protein